MSEGETVEVGVSVAVPAEVMAAGAGEAREAFEKAVDQGTKELRALVDGVGPIDLKVIAQPRVVVDPLLGMIVPVQIVGTFRLRELPTNCPAVVRMREDEQMPPDPSPSGLTP